jgi:membrane fusion protein (multidrug efflux system)
MKAPVAVKVAIFALLAFGVASQRPASGQMPQMPPPEVEVAPATMKTLPRVGEAVGRVESSNTVEIRARVGGFLQEQFFADGAMVKKGQPLFKIESGSYVAALNMAKANLAKARATLSSARQGVAVIQARAQLASAKAELAKAGKDFARIKPLADAKAISKQTLDAAQAAYDSAKATANAFQAALEQARINQKTDIELGEASVQSAQAAVDTMALDLSYTDVTATIDGRIGRAQQLTGALVGKDMATPTLLATISAVDPMWANWSVSEQEYLALTRDGTQAGFDLGDKFQKIELILSDGRVYKQLGKIDFVDRAIDKQTGTLALRAAFPNPDGLLRDGQFCKVRTTRVPKNPSLMIPARAVQQLQGQSFVLVIDEKSCAQQRPVQLGERVGDEQEILGGLKPGENVIVEGSQKVLMPGMPVKPVPAGSGAAASASASGKRG